MGRSSLSYEDFKRAVLRGEERWAIDIKQRKFIPTLAETELEVVEPSCSPKAMGALTRLRPAAARGCRALLKDAREELAIAKTAGDVRAQRVTLIGIHSAYRTNQEETFIWNDNYPNYYRATRADRVQHPRTELRGDARGFTVGLPAPTRREESSERPLMAFIR